MTEATPALDSATEADSLQSPSMSETIGEKAAWLAVGVSALGYFVDVFDMWLFSNFRVASLKSLGLAASEITTTCAFIINCQQAGFLIGGFIRGVMGDKKDRVSVMFSSILLYSIANITNAFVETIAQYAALRFMTCRRLAAENGAELLW